MKGLIFNIQKFSIHDGPGIRTTVFFKGCPLSCKWCANPESQSDKLQVSFTRDNCINCESCVSVCPTQALTTGDGTPQFDPGKCVGNLKCLEACPAGALTVEGRYATVDEIVEKCLQDKVFYEESGGGVTISGGEGMAQPEFLFELTKALKANGIHLAIETTGHIETDVFKKLAPQFDLLLFDVKHYDSQEHKEGTGADNEQILDNLNWALLNKIPVLVRIPIIPYFNDTIEDAQNFVELFNDLGIDKVQLLPFHQFGEKKYERLRMPYTYKNEPSLHPEDLEEYQKVFTEADIDCFF